MDHRISKDMISSGMIPSGEKKQEDLGKTQYGTVPSPNALSDVYKKMYETKEEVINEMSGMGMTPKKAPAPAAAVKKEVPPAPATKKETPKTDSRMDQVVKHGFAKSYRRIGPKSETEDMLDRVTDRKIDRKVDKDMKRDRLKKIMADNESIDLLAAYRAVYEHHKKDADGNTIPHEDEEIEEGAGLYANIHAKRKRGGKMRKKGAKGAPSSQDFANAAKTAKEEVDLFDVISEKLIEEGYSKKESYEIMSNLTEEQLEELNEFVVSGTLATLGAIGSKLAAGTAAAGKMAMGAVKAGGAALKSGMKGVVSAAKGGVSSVKSGMKGVTNAAKNVTKPKVTSSGGKIEQGSSNTGGNKIMDFAKREAGFKARQELSKDRQASGTNKTKQTSAPTTNVAASADLFDIVKGQLLDEGLSEEEIKDIMLTLTPDEILKEMGDYPAGKGGNYRETPKPNKPEPKPGEPGSKLDAKGRQRFNPLNKDPYSGKTSKYDEEYKQFDPKKPDPKQVAAQAQQEKNRQKSNDPMGVKNKNIGGQGLDPMDK